MFLAETRVEVMFFDKKVTHNLNLLVMVILSIIRMLRTFLDSVLVLGLKQEGGFGCFTKNA